MSRSTAETIIRPIVEGQLRTFGHAHPAVVEAVDWRHSHPTKLDAFVASAAKRITTALLADQTVDRLRSALSVGALEIEEVKTSVLEPVDQQLLGDLRPEQSQPALAPAGAPRVHIHDAKPGDRILPPEGQPDFDEIFLTRL